MRRQRSKSKSPSEESEEAEEETSPTARPSKPEKKEKKEKKDKPSNGGQRTPPQATKIRVRTPPGPTAAPVPAPLEVEPTTTIRNPQQQLDYDLSRTAAIVKAMIRLPMQLGLGGIVSQFEDRLRVTMVGYEAVNFHLIDRVKNKEPYWIYIEPSDALKATKGGKKLTLATTAQGVETRFRQALTEFVDETINMLNRYVAEYSNDFKRQIARGCACDLGESWELLFKGRIRTEGPAVANRDIDIYIEFTVNFVDRFGRRSAAYEVPIVEFDGIRDPSREAVPINDRRVTAFWNVSYASIGWLLDDADYHIREDTDVDGSYQAYHNTLTGALDKNNISLETLRPYLNQVCGSFNQEFINTLRPAAEQLTVKERISGAYQRYLDQLQQSLGVLGFASIERDFEKALAVAPGEAES